MERESKLSKLKPRKHLRLQLVNNMFLCGRWDKPTQSGPLTNIKFITHCSRVVSHTLKT